jgi:WD40 repeat protein
VVVVARRYCLLLRKGECLDYIWNKRTASCGDLIKKPEGKGKEKFQSKKCCKMKRAYKLQEFVAHTSNVNCLKIGKKSSRVLVTGGEDHKVNMWAIGKPNAILVRQLPLFHLPV